MGIYIHTNTCGHDQKIKMICMHGHERMDMSTHVLWISNKSLIIQFHFTCTLISRQPQTNALIQHIDTSKRDQMHKICVHAYTLSMLIPQTDSHMRAQKSHICAYEGGTSTRQHNFDKTIIKFSKQISESSMDVILRS